MPKEEWKPKTDLGRRVKAGEFESLNDILKAGLRITEPEIVDFLVPNVQVDFINIGQSKGKFGGGKRRIYRVTQKKTAEGNKIKFTAMCVVGSPEEGFVGLGWGSSGETVPARTKAERSAKMSIIKVLKGSGSWESTVDEPHSFPFKVSGKEGSVRLTFIPAAKGTGLAVDDSSKQLLRMAGFKDAWSITSGQTQTRINLVKAAFKALKQTREMRT